MIVEAKAPTRIDLAGGTIDLWPLYLFHPGAQTVNVAIDLFASCRVASRTDTRIVLRSKDIGAEEEYASLAETPLDSPLQLLARLVAFFAPQTGVEVTTDCAAPAGSGLGGSSALVIALAGALNRLTGRGYDEKALLTIAPNIETQVIKVPAGVQDYYPPVYGGANAIHLGVDGVSCERLPDVTEALQERIVLCYTGKPHFSGTNNWEIFKRHIDGDPDVFTHLERIRETTTAMRDAVLAGDAARVADRLNEEWENRKRLSVNVSTEKIDHLIETARRNGALAGKVCGAGGGGCVTFVVAEGRKSETMRALTAAGGEVLDVKLTERGLDITERNE
jgi:D-glycero-alpha-D-manno-heptose-7-phosphate kinase